MNYVGLTIFLLSITLVLAQFVDRPHIILIVADDLGWNDVSFHGSSQIPTPNIDALAYNGMILNQHYVQPICTPSRAALMTGKYPIYTGLQGYPLRIGDTRRLPPGKILPGHLKDLGYVTRLVGKWHLGYSSFNDTPTQRGFDSHFGHWTGFMSYYDYVHEGEVGGKIRFGYDLHRNRDVAWEYEGRYATDVYTEEAVKLIAEHDTSSPLFLMLSHLAVHSGNSGKLLEAPQETINEHSHIADINRRTYAAMVSSLDDSVGEVIKALKERQMLDNSIIVFISDNGAPTIGEHRNWGSNYPLRGVKETLWEGGVRGAACIWSPILQGRGVHNGLMHISDWFPTLISAAGGDPGAFDINGLDQWPTLAYHYPNERREILLNFEDVARTAAIRRDHWKLHLGIYEEGKFDGYYGAKGTENKRSQPYDIDGVQKSIAARSLASSGYSFDSSIALRNRDRATVKCPTRDSIPEGGSISNCNPTRQNSVCLFNLREDPCETNDLSQNYPYVVKQLKAALVYYKKGLIPQEQDTVSIDSLPELYNFTWSNWQDKLPTTDFRKTEL